MSRETTRESIAILAGFKELIEGYGLEAAQAHHQRSDVCAVPAAGVVAEAMVALVLAELMLDKFGGDSLAETSRNHRAYLDRLAERRLA